MRTSGAHPTAPKDAKRAEFLRQLLEGAIKTDEASPSRQLDFSISKVRSLSLGLSLRSIQTEIMWFFEQMKANTRVGSSRKFISAR